MKTAVKPAVPRPVIRLAPLALLGSLLCGAPSSPAMAGDGTLLTFGLGFRLASDSNPALTPVNPVNPGPSTTTALDLSFGLSEESAQSKLVLGLSGSLAQYGGSGNTASNGLVNPNLTLAYSHTAGDAEFSLNGGLTTANLGQNTAVTDFQTGAGTRRTATLSTGVSFGKTGPLGLDLTAGQTDVTYQNAPGLLASRTLQLGATAHTDLSPVLHLGLGLHNSRFSQDGQSARNTPGLNASLTLDRKTGSYVASLTSDRAPEGRRSTLELSHQLDLAAGGSLSYNLGATRAATGSSYVVGALAYQQTLAQGAVSLGLNRAVQANAFTNAETVVSAANLGYTRDITPRGSLALALNWAQQRDTAFGLVTANTNLSATWTQALAADWALDFGYTRRLRAQDFVGQSHSDSLFLTLHRDFSVRY